MFKKRYQKDEFLLTGKKKCGLNPHVYANLFTLISFLKPSQMISLDCVVFGTP